MSGGIKRSGEGETVVSVRYGELFLKSEPVKRRFIRILLDTIRRALEEKGVEFRLKSPRGRILIHGEDADTIARTTARVFGVVDTAICTLTDTSPEDLSRAAVACAASRLTPGMSFAVRVRRQVKEGMSGPELGALLGSAIMQSVPGARVNLGTPEYEVFVEVRDIGGLVCDRRFTGPGGLPFGTQGRFISLLSAGIDSPVAAWLMMKRGCIPEFLFLDSGTWSGSDVRAGALGNLEKLSLWCPGFPLRMDLVSNEMLFHRLEEKAIPPRFHCVICKRFMYRIGSIRVREADALVLVTGENLGQVASQTLQNLATISDAIAIPVIRPVITYDKGEIVSLARRIGTFPGHGGDLSCRAVPHKPATGADPEMVRNLEEDLNLVTLAQEALTGRRVITALNGRIRDADRQ